MATWNEVCLFPEEVKLLKKEIKKLLKAAKHGFLEDCYFEDAIPVTVDGYTDQAYENFIEVCLELCSERSPWTPGILNGKSGQEYFSELWEAIKYAVETYNIYILDDYYDIDKKSGSQLNKLCKKIGLDVRLESPEKIAIGLYILDIILLPTWEIGENNNPDSNPEAVPVEEFTTTEVVEGLSPELQENVAASTPSPKETLNDIGAEVEPDPSIPETLFDNASDHILESLETHVGAAMQGKPSLSDNAFIKDPGPASPTSDEPSRRSEEEEAAIAEEQEEEQQQIEQNVLALENQQIEEANEEQAEKEEQESAGIMEKIAEALEKVNEVKDQAMAKVTEAVNKAMTKANELQAKAQEATIGKVLKKFEELVNKLLEKEKGKIHELVETLGEEMKVILSKEPLDPEEFAKAANKLQERAVDGARKMAENIKASIDEQADKITSAIQLELYQDKISQQAEKIQTKLKEAMDKAQAAIAKAMNKVDSAIKKVLGKLNALAGK